MGVVPDLQIGKKVDLLMIYYPKNNLAVLIKLTINAVTVIAAVI